LAFDQKNNLVVATFPGATPPSLMFYDADTFEMLYNMSAHPLSGIGQPAWNRFDGLLYITIFNDQGIARKIVVVDGATREIVRKIKQDLCVSHGLVIGLPGQGYVSCSGDALQDLGDKGRNSYVINTETGDKNFTIEGVSGIDEVNYDTRRHLFLVAASRNKPDPVLAIISAMDGKTLQTIKMTDKISRAVAVDESTGSFMIPTKEGFAIYRPEGSSCKRR
jgi:hypothetical protein